MLRILILSLLGLSVTHSAVTPPSLHLVQETSLLPPRSQNLSTTATDITEYLNGSLPQIYIDPHLTYETLFADQILDKKSAYLNTLLALAELSTKGWSERMRYESMYSFKLYGDVTIRIHARSNPSSLQFRYAIWGLYSAVRESSANKFKATFLTLYWSPIVGKSRHVIGYVSILGGSNPNINLGPSPDDALEQVIPTQANLLASAPAPANVTSVSIDNSITLSINHMAPPKLVTKINLERKQLPVDAVFHTLYAGIVHLASFPQSDPIIHPGFVRDDTFETFLRWDWSHLSVQHLFLYKYAINALSALPVYMYAHNQFSEVRFIVYVNGLEVGRGWLYKNGLRETSDAE